MVSSGKICTEILVDQQAKENAIALTHVEEALLWLNKRVDDRAERGVLGLNKEAFE